MDWPLTPALLPVWRGEGVVNCGYSVILSKKMVKSTSGFWLLYNWVHGVDHRPSRWLKGPIDAGGDIDLAGEVQARFTSALAEVGAFEGHILGADVEVNGPGLV